jgi:hypothetical protein
VRLIVYIDDILILAESRELARDHVIGLVYLLESKPIEPTQSFSVCSLSQELSLPARKRIRTETRSLLANGQVSIKEAVPNAQAATRVVPLAPVFFRKLQQALR